MYVSFRASIAGDKKSSLARMVCLYNFIQYTFFYKKQNIFLRLDVLNLGHTCADFPDLTLPQLYLKNAFGPPIQVVLTDP